jgi:hypothetical protein
MTELSAGPTILWDTLKLSAEPLRARSDILVIAQVEVRKSDAQGSDTYRVSFEINRHHGLVSQDTEVLVSVAGLGRSLWRYSGRRDILVAVKDHFLKTQLYSYVARQLGWLPGSSVSVSHAPLDP